MKTQTNLNFLQSPDYQWFENGQSAFSGNILKLYYQLEQLFLSWAKDYNAKEYLFPSFISAVELERLDYFRSFPHLATFPVFLKPDLDNLTRFASNQKLLENGEIQATKLNTIREVLTPATCYNIYIHFQGRNFDSPLYVTSQANCFRRESHYLPLERQWHFRMREIVCIGTVDEVKAFLAYYQEKLNLFFNQINLKIDWNKATDPFFNPDKNPKYLVQKIYPIKTEMTFQDRLAIGSFNFHSNYFGEKFQIYRNEKAAFSGCVAFGLERWMLAFLTHFDSIDKALEVLNFEENND